MLEDVYVESKEPKPIAEMWKEYADQFVCTLPEHEQYRVKHAFYHAIYTLLIDLNKIPDDEDAFGEQLESWDEEVSDGIDNMGDEFAKISMLLPYEDEANVKRN